MHAVFTSIAAAVPASPDKKSPGPRVIPSSSASFALWVEVPEAVSGQADRTRFAAPAVPPDLTTDRLRVAVEPLVLHATDPDSFT